MPIHLVQDWRDEIIYQIMIDRFEDGDPSNNFNVNTSIANTVRLAGVIDRLDYIELSG